jgi:hypothetical protein
MIYIVSRKCDGFSRKADWPPLASNPFFAITSKPKNKL